jgi:hypothetical protein
MTDSDDHPKETSRRYRNPPVEHRFRKGVSGNPRGRPPKTRALVSTKIGGQPGIGFEDRIKSLAIQEAYRIIQSVKAIGSKGSLSSRLSCANSPSQQPTAMCALSKVT